MESARKAIIVGGGIGGLAAAIALHNRGWRVEVLEHAPEFTAVGAGLSVWPNGLRALELLGVGDAVRDQALLDFQAGIKDPTGRWLTHTDTTELEQRYGKVAMIHRADLLETLRAAVPSSALRTGVDVQEVHSDGRVEHSAGSSRGDLVVGADGIHSVVRRSVAPMAAEPRHVGYATWRMVTAPVPLNEGGETWGHGQRLGYAPLPDGRAYVFAVVAGPAGSLAGERLPELRRRFGDWHDPIPRLLEAADDVTVHHDDLYELPPMRSFVFGHAC